MSMLHGHEMRVDILLSLPVVHRYHNDSRDPEGHRR